MFSIAFLLLIRLCEELGNIVFHYFLSHFALCASDFTSGNHRMTQTPVVDIRVVK